MEPPEFASLVADLASAMGQRPDAVRSSPDGLLLRTTDGFLFAFLEDPAHVSLAQIQRLLAEPPAREGRLVVLTPGRLPLALAAELDRGRVSLVEHERFRELLRGLDLGERVGEEPRPPHDQPGPRLLPSARRLDATVARARTWLEWGVPALSLRFYRQALAQKPEFSPARLGVARCLAALGLAREARAAFEALLAVRPDDVDAKLGLSSLHADAGEGAEERKIYREILDGSPERVDVRAQLIAAEIDAHRWAEALTEIETLLAKAPENARVRFLHAAALTHLGHPREAGAERDRARSLGLTYEEERSLAEQVDLPAPAPHAAPGTRRGPASIRRTTAAKPHRASPSSPRSRPRGRRRARSQPS